MLCRLTVSWDWGTVTWRSKYTHPDVAHLHLIPVRIFTFQLLNVSSVNTTNGRFQCVCHAINNRRLCVVNVYIQSCRVMGKQFVSGAEKNRMALWTVGTVRRRSSWKTTTISAPSSTPARRRSCRGPWNGRDWNQ